MKERFLIVEDDAIIAYSLTIILEKKGYNVIEAVNNAKDAYHYCKVYTPDVILLDIGLVGSQTGIDLANRLKKEGHSSSIIYITALNDDSTISEIKKTDPILFINKPFISEVLLANIELVLNHLREKIQLIKLEDGSKNIAVNIKNIKYIQSDRNYVRIELNDGNHYQIRNKLNDIEKLILAKTTRFTRVHQSYLVNDHYITLIQKNKIEIDNLSITISKKYLDGYREKWKLNH